jgi:plasmid maintenance system antidote protein VapI
MTVSDLAKVLKMPASVLSEVVNGRRLSRKTEEKIAAFFGKSREELFPGRSLYDLMLLSEQEKRGA